MGAQQFGTGATLIDTTALNRVLSFDPERGLIEVEAGIQWPALINHLSYAQNNKSHPWGIAQKQTGADRFSIGGTIAANSHGRGLTMRPFIEHVESFSMVNAEGELMHCSRSKDRELFRLVVGGYGLFGVIVSATLRLIPRQKMERIVAIMHVDELMTAFEERIDKGYVYGDFQFAIDETGPYFLSKGVLSAYRPVAMDTHIPDGQSELSRDDWLELANLAHTNKALAFDRYAKHYLSTSGQIYWSDTHQLSIYEDNYHELIDKKRGNTVPASEIITELYVPRDALLEFMRAARKDFRENNVDVIYGTIRLIEKDTESFLAWARESFACIVFNLHTSHSVEGVEHSVRSLQRLIDLAIGFGGSYSLAYHKYATRQHVETCYPQFKDFLNLKHAYDPADLFQSDWYRHYKSLFDDGI